MARAGASYPSIFLGLDASRVQAGLESVKRMWSATMATLTAPAKTALIGTALANQAAEFGGKLTRLFGEPFRQLMEQEDLTSRFSLVAGGADKSSQAFEGFRRVSRETGVAIADMAAGLETLLQGQFSFEGARQQILDLTNVAAVLGQGSLPMLAAAAAKFRSQAFAGFEDINQVAAQGIPIYDALAQRLGVTADEARRMAREGLVTGLQARGALNDAANAQAVRGAGGAQEQTLSGVVSRLREGLNQTLATIGEAVSRAVDVPTVLARFRGFVEGIRSVVEAGLGPLKNVIGPDGGGLKEKFQSAQEFTINALKAVSDGFFSFLRGLEAIVNRFGQTTGLLTQWLSEKFTPAQEQLIEKFRNDNAQMVVGNNGLPPGFNFFGGGREQLVPLGRFAAIEALRKQGQLPEAVNLGNPIDFGVNGMQVRVNEALAAAQKKVVEQNGQAAKAADEMAAAQRRLVEDQNQATQALDMFLGQFSKTFETPVDQAQKQLAQLDALMAQAVNITAEQAALADRARAQIGKSLLDQLEGVNQAFENVKLAGSLSSNTAELNNAISRAMVQGTEKTGSVQDRIAKGIQRSADIAERHRAIGAQTLDAIKRLPAGGANLAVVNF